MGTVLWDKEQGFRVVIYTNDHHPAHVHVLCSDPTKKAVVSLLGADGTVVLIAAYDMSPAEIRRAVKLVNDKRVLLLAKWEDIHGRAD